MEFRDWATIFLLGLLFGGSFFFTEIANADVGPLTIAASRLVIGGVALVVVIVSLGKAEGARLPFWPIIGMGLFNSFLPISLIAWAQVSIPVGLTSILAATSPVFGAVFAHFAFEGETLTIWRLVGTGLAFAGVVLILDPANALQLELRAAPFAVLAAAASSAAAGVFGRRIMSAGASPLLVATGQVLVAACLATCLALFIEKPWMRPLPGISALSALLAMGLLSTALAYFLFFRLLGRVGAARTLLVGFLVPISATLLGIALLGESLEMRELAGLVIVLLSLFVITKGRRA